MSIDLPNLLRRAAGMLLPVCAAGVALLPATAAAGQPQSYIDLVKRLTDLDGLTRLQTGITAGQFSSWDRNMTKAYGANGDAGQYLRVEPNGEAVMMDIDGPGCIWRIWSANPQGKIRVYLDGAEKPTYEWDFNQLFKGDIQPFVKPLVWQRADRQASDSYVPIPFAKHIKITADKAYGQYYHFGYHLYPKERAVESLKLPLTGDETSALYEAAAAWGRKGVDPKERLTGQVTVTTRIEIAPGATVNLASLRGPGIIRGIRISAASEQRYVWRKVVLQAVWDKAPWPQVLTPLGPFFGFDWEAPDYGSVIAGCKGNQAYNFYAMPFRRSGEIQATSYLDRPAQLDVQIDWAPVESLPADMCYFYARWRSEPGITDFDYSFLETAGKGHFVGVSMPIDHPLGGWWGEGDEKVWVDEDDFPKWVGTGSEDYFGDAWGIRYLSGGSWGCSSQVGHRTCNYRWHFADFIPFTKRFRMVIENYGPNGVGPRGHYEFTSTAFWYQAELTPPFSELAGATVTGGLTPNEPPSKVRYNTRPFRALDAQALRTYGSGVTFADEAEEVLRDAVRAGSGSIISDSGLKVEFSRERAVDFGQATQGGKLADFTLRAPKAGVYYPQLISALPDAAPLTMQVAGKALEVVAATPGVAALQAVLIDGKGEPASIIATAAGRAVLDCVRLEPAWREARAVEVEEQKLSASAGPPAPETLFGDRSVSGGRLVHWAATEDGQSLTITLSEPAPETRVLGLKAHAGPDGGLVQASIDGKAIGPVFDLYAPTAGAIAGLLPLGVIPAGTAAVEIRCVGKNAASSGRVLTADFLRYEPQVLAEGSDEGVWIQIGGVSGGGYEAQNLGPAFSGGHQLWIMPSGLNAAVELLVHVPKEGQYDLAARLTTSHDYAVVQAELDGSPIGPQVDTYTLDVKRGPETVLGKVKLTAGVHRLRFKAVGKNPASDGSGYLMGIDDVSLKSAP